MDPRRRAVDLRRFLRIGALFVGGAILVGIGLLLSRTPDPVGPDYVVGHRRDNPELGFLVAGAVLIAAGLFEIGLRLVKGPQEPGKHARD